MHLFYKLLLWGLLVTSGTLSSAAQQEVTSRDYTETDGPLELNASVSSEVVNVSDARSSIECLRQCQKLACSFAITTEQATPVLCQLVVVFNDSLSPGPPGSHVTRLLGSETGARVWRAAATHVTSSASASSGPNFEFTSSSTGRSGSIQQAVISVTGCYLIEVAGARGGRQAFASTPTAGGRGARAAGNFSLTAGTQLAIVVGQAGGPANAEFAGAGGGGGSFVYRTADNQLLMAAGGGGGGASAHDGRPGLSGPNGSDSIGSAGNEGFGGTNGQPGYCNVSATISTFMFGTFMFGGCGAGWLGKAVNARRSTSDGDRGGGLADGWVGGSAGVGSTGDGGNALSEQGFASLWLLAPLMNCSDIPSGF